MHAGSAQPVVIGSDDDKATREEVGQIGHAIVDRRGVRALHEILGRVVVK